MKIYYYYYLSLLSLLGILSYPSIAIAKSELKVKKEDTPFSGLGFFCHLDSEEYKSIDYVKGDETSKEAFECKKKIDPVTNEVSFQLKIYPPHIDKMLRIIVDKVECRQNICILTEAPIDYKRYHPLYILKFKKINEKRIKLISSNIRYVDPTSNWNACVPNLEGEDFFKKEDEYIFEIR
ncbi:hypothetical protein AB3N62_06965 [Leptospira sp. WS4.C2]